MKMEKEKFSKKHLIKLVVAIGLLVGIGALLLFLANKPKTPATPEQVMAVLDESQYPYADLTEAYEEKWESDGALQKAITAETERLRFEFFIFDSVSIAHEYMNTCTSYIHTNYYKRPYRLNEDHMSNWRNYILKTEDDYAVCLRVDNTVVYGHCDAEYASELRDIIVDIGYLE